MIQIFQENFLLLSKNFQIFMKKYLNWKKVMILKKINIIEE